jgi:hypothetical protein
VRPIEGAEPSTAGEGRRGERRAERRREQAAVASAIFGTESRAAIFEQVNAFCGSHLESGVSEFLLYEIGRHATVFGVELADGRRLVVKAVSERIPRDRQDAVHRVQTLLHQRRFPCPRPVLGPQPLGSGHARVEELVESGDERDPHEPRVRRAMAQLLARQIQLAGGETPGGIETMPTIFDRPGLWGDARRGRHAGTPWVAAFAEPAKRLAATDGKKLVAHGDWTGKNMRFARRGVKVVYDWDSLQYETEERVLGRVSAKFTVLPKNPNPPSPDESRAFVDDYEKARGKRFTGEERERIAGARTFAIAYKAHVEYGKKSGRRGAWQQALKDFGADYLEP